MAIQLILLDLDGTLLTREKTISPANYAALERAQRAGIHIVPSTGRFFDGMPQVVRDLPFFRYVITVNGAQIYDRETDTILHRCEIQPQDAQCIYEKLDTLPVIYDCFQDGWGWMDQTFYDMTDLYGMGEVRPEWIRKMRTPVEDFRGTIRRRNRGIQKTQMFFRDMALRAKMLDELPQRFPDLSITTSLVNNIEINSGDAHKGAALLELCRQLNIDPADTMAFGDGLNDLTMLKAAGIGVAMGNAVEQVKAAADFVTDTNDNDGVAKAIRYFCFEN